MKNNEAPDHCGLCKGQCCKNLAGSYTPEDIGTITPEHILDLLNTGKYAIDWWDGDARFTLVDTSRYYNLSRTYYLRPRHRNLPAIAKLNDPDHAPSTCINLTPKGCSLSFKERPYQCKALIPNFNKETNEPNCMIKRDDMASRQDIAIMWVPYQKVLEKAMELYKDQQAKKRRKNLTYLIISLL